jgi:chemotaxis-related protein WspB
MLALLLYAGSNTYAFDVRSVVEVVHAVELRELPHAPPIVRGVLNLRRQPVPVLDLSKLTGGMRCDAARSTRIVLVHYPSREKPDHILGLMAERVTETRNVEQRDLRATGIMVRGAKYLDRVIPDSTRMIQWLNIEHLLPDEIKTSLFQEAAS